MSSLIGRLLDGASVDDEDIIRVDTILNHQIDVDLIEDIGKELARRFKGAGVTKVLTAEASGIAVSCFIARALGVPAVYAKKFQTGYMSGEVYETEIHSFSQNKAYTLRVSKQLISPDDVILIADDFLANGLSLMGLCDIVSMAGAEVAGAAVIIEKAYKEGGGLLRQMDIRVEAILRVLRIEGGRLIIDEE